MNKQSIIGLVLIFAIFVGYMWWVTPTEEERIAMVAKQDSIQQAYNDSIAAAKFLEEKKAEKAASIASGDTAAQHRALADLQARLGAFGASADGDTGAVCLKNEKMQIRINTLGASVDQVVLNEYTTYENKQLELITPDPNNMNMVFSTEDNRVINTNELVFVPYINDQPIDANSVLEVANGDSLTLQMRAYTNADSLHPTPGYLEFEYTMKDNYELDFNINFHDLTKVVRNVPYIDFYWKNQFNRQEKVDQGAKGKRNRNKDSERFNTSVYYKPVNDKVDKIREGMDGKQNIKSSLNWIAYKQQFFCAILMNDEGFVNADMSIATDRQDTTNNYLCDMSSLIGVTYEGDKDYTMDMEFYFGPNKYRDLRAMHQGFERMLPLGWGFFLTQWISRFVIIPVFNFMERFNWNYGFIIIILTILVKLLLFPMTYKSYRTSAVMRILKPDMDELNKRYPREDQMMQKQQAMMMLQKKAGMSPMAGCLPMLLQMPILIAMFRFFPASIELRQKPFLWCDDLSTYDSILDFGFNIPLYGDHFSLFCFLMFALQLFYTWYTMKGQPNTGMPGMKFMMYFMPFMMLFMFNSMSAALNLYYFLSLSITMLQMILIRKFTNERKLRERMAAYDTKHSGKGAKKSKFQKRLEEIQKMSEQMQRQQQQQQRR